MGPDFYQLLHCDGSGRHTEFLSGYTSGKLEIVNFLTDNTGVCASHVNLIEA